LNILTKGGGCVKKEGKASSESPYEREGLLVVERLKSFSVA
jgi:hypothetical protein